MNLIERDDPLYFTETSSESYDRHQYKVVGKQGKTVILDSWQEAQELWWNSAPILSHIEVLDRKETGGFANG
jgi:hypothetical protein|tara:strand:+ start:4458 stop:4673 length:216 start_codon:yes stop_codon:yes gene_type:complete